MRRKIGYFYILASDPHGTLYTGVTHNLMRRLNQHRQELTEGFTKKYHVHKLIYYEMYDDITDAIAQETRIKHWNRAWKIRLIRTKNPNWKDLSENW